MVSGLASSIRSATESATFDLAGSDAPSIQSTVEDAFSAPFPLSSMIRVTFVTGGGKSSRSRYDDGAARAVTSTLRRLGYEEDRGASCVLECGGCFKSQHDTGRNVYTVVVFPKVTGGGGDDGGNLTEEDDEPLIPTNSPGYKMAVCSKNTFQNLLSTYCPTYFEKRECLGCLEGLLQLEEAIENKLMHGHPLDSAEQSFYDDSSDLKEKHAYAQKETTKHVEDGRLTLDERAALVEMNDKRIETLMKETSSASVAEKLKKALARKQQLISLSNDVLEECSSSYPPPLRHESQIAPLRKKLLPLRALEESSKGRLLTLGETRSLTEKGEIEEEIERLEYASCGWFEDQDAFQRRLKKSRDAFESKYARSKRGGGGGKKTSIAAGKGGGGNAVNKWILPGEKPKSAWGSKSTVKKLKGKGGAVFSAMMMDSSSDEEEDESDEEGSAEEDAREEQPFTVVSAPKKQHPVANNTFGSKKAAALLAKKSNSPSLAKGGNDDNIHKESTDDSKSAGTGSTSQTKKGKKKKKNKKKSKQTTEQQEETAREVVAAEKETSAEYKDENKTASVNEAPSTVSGSLLEFWRSLLFPFIMFVLNVLTSLVIYLFFSGSKKKGGKKKRS